MTIEMRCRHKAKAAELDAETLTIALPCKRCSRLGYGEVYHRWSLADLLRAIGAGQVEGVVFPSDDVRELPLDSEH